MSDTPAADARLARDAYSDLGYPTEVPDSLEILERLIAYARAEEREACAQLADDVSARYQFTPDKPTGLLFADLIRARSTT